MKKIVVSGVQVTGNLHLGNYLGALNNWISMQDTYKCFFFLADLHSLTSDIEPAFLNNSTISTAATYFASGLDPKKSIIFPQSLVPAHTELAWILNCITPIGWLNRMTQFKDKAVKGIENSNLGLLSYPVLMAADILLYKANLVPVGKDQKQHLELTRDIAGLINRKFNKKIFDLPENLTYDSTTKIMSLKDGTKKMSKSDSSDLSRINLSDDNDTIFQKIKKAKTDNISYLSYDKETRPEISNLIDIYRALDGSSKEQIIKNYESTSFTKFKQDLSEIIIEKLTPINNEYNKLMNNQDYIINILKEGALKAQSHAAKTLSEVKNLFGLIKP